MKCKICLADTQIIFEAQVLHKYLVHYFKCNLCGFICTEEPYWLNEAYSSAIANSDTGIMDRNLYFKNKIPIILKMLGCNLIRDKFMDYAGGGGILVRLMRDIGLDFYWHDKYCQNWVANGFEADLTQKFNAVTTFESFEHFVDPMTEIENILNYTDVLIFSTQLQPTIIPDKNWWYYAFSDGQHISFYSKSTMEFIAKKFGYNFYTFGLLHCFSKKTLSPLSLKISKRLINHTIFSRLLFYNAILGLKSKTIDDMNYIRAYYANKT